MNTGAIAASIKPTDGDDVNPAHGIQALLAKIREQVRKTATLMEYAYLIHNNCGLKV